MRWWWHFCLLLILSSAVWAQQGQSPSSNGSSPSTSSASSASQDSGSSNQSGNSVPKSRDSSNQQDSSKSQSALPPNMSPPRSDMAPADQPVAQSGDSSSRDEHIDLSPPPNDAKAHPNSSEAVADEESKRSEGGVSEFKVWDPHRAAKEVEVGDFYFKRKNYRAAESRYREALRYKDNDAVATFRLGVCLEKEGFVDDAIRQYQRYLKILPSGPEAPEAQKAINRLKAENIGPK
jgi:tetratricopeptide (TPR) repeat protein